MHFLQLRHPREEDIPAHNGPSLQRSAPGTDPKKQESSLSDKLFSTPGHCQLENVGPCHALIPLFYNWKQELWSKHLPFLYKMSKGPQPGTQVDPFHSPTKYLKLVKPVKPLFFVKMVRRLRESWKVKKNNW